MNAVLRPARAALALGGNVGDAAAVVRDALAALDGLEETRVVRRSGLYRSAPVGPPQPDYVNAAALVDTRLAPLALLDRLQALEDDFGRARDGERWGPRTLDLDIVAYADLQARSPRLTLPHAEAWHRCFVLAPLCEIAPDFVIPGRGRAVDLLPACDTGAAVALDEAGAA